MKSLRISTQNLLEKSNMKSQYRNFFFSLFLALYFKTPLAGWQFCLAVSSWFIEATLAGWVLAFISVCLETRWLGPNSGFYVLQQPCNVLD